MNIDECVCYSFPLDSACCVWYDNTAVCVCASVGVEAVGPPLPS